MMMCKTSLERTLDCSWLGVGYKHALFKTRAAANEVPGTIKEQVMMWIKYRV
jgi:hypothetical protein